MANWFMKEPCAHCPFRTDVKPFLHPRRAEDIAYSTSNPYNEFTCHQTLESIEDADGEEALARGNRSLTCAGFLSMQIDYGGARCPKGFVPSGLVYSDPSEMAEAYEIEWNARRQPRKAG